MCAEQMTRREDGIEFYQCDKFRQFIRGLLSLSGIRSSYLDALTDTDGMRVYQDVFTHSSVNAQHNYEWLEILGDATLNKSIVWYISKRFPFLQNAEGVKVIARLKINMVSKKNFSELAASLGMGEFVRYDVQQLPSHNVMAIRSILEDVFEAFFGATEWLIDRCVEPGAGYGICFVILSKILDRTEISLEYNDLFDAVTRLKETFDMFRNRIQGTLRYENHRENFHQHVTIFHAGSHGSTPIGRGLAPTLDEARQSAAADAIRFFEKNGIVKPIPPYYLRIRSLLHTPSERRS